jgi:aminoglycoside phosphotransferase (APT) family kinase protein
MTPPVDTWAEWPQPVTEHLRRMHGEPLAVERLGGMSVARVYRVRFAARSVVVKTSPRPAEARFYESTAGRLRAAAVPIPRLEWLAHLPEGHWLVLEDIPTPLPVLPPDRWQPDPRVIAVLVRLHQTTRRMALDFPYAQAHAWTDGVTDTALRCFPTEGAEELAPRLRALQYQSAHLAAGWCWISGDTSPPNWGVRPDGTVALYDWELFRPGVPASDLAPVVPGLGDPDEFRRVAADYLAECDRSGEPLPWTLDALTRDVALAKLATVVMLLAAHAEGRARIPEDHIAWLVAAVPSWLQGF